MRRDWKWIIAGTVAVTASAIVILAFAQADNSHRNQEKEAAKDETTQAPARVSTQDGQGVVTLDASTQAVSGLRLATLDATTRRPEIRATAVVLQTQDLTDLRKGYLSVVIEAEKAKISVNASKQEYDRLNALYQQDQNASAKAMQAAEATWKIDEANVTATQNVVALTESAVRQSWGGVVGSWIADGSAALNRILQQHDLLLQVSLALASSNPPATASIQTADGKIQSAKFVSRFPRVDPRIQSPTFLYVTPSRLDLVPGMNLAVLLPSGPPLRGVIIPGNAIVWWQGRAWAYAQSGANRFSRREVPTETPAGDGWFLTTGFSPGDKLVVTGAQQLLSQELRAEAKVLGGEKDE